MLTKNMKNLAILLVIVCFCIGCSTSQESAETDFPNVSNVKEYTDEDGTIKGFSFTSIIEEVPRRLYRPTGRDYVVCLEGCGTSEVSTKPKSREEVLNELTPEQKSALGL